MNVSGRGIKGLGLRAIEKAAEVGPVKGRRKREIEMGVHKEREHERRVKMEDIERAKVEDIERAKVEKEKKAKKRVRRK